VSIPRLFGGMCDFAERPPGTRHHGSRHGTFNERGVDETDVPVAVSLEDMTHGEDCAPQVTQYDDAIASVRRRDSGSDRLISRAQAPIRAAARRRDRHLGARDLSGKLGQPVCQGRAM
jgi:hypothetical protein